MSEDWKAGDVAVHIRVPNARRDPVRAPLVNGRHYRVEDVVLWGGEFVVLVLVGHYSSHPCRGYNARAFRKLNDGTDDAELIARIKNCKPVRGTVSA